MARSDGSQEDFKVNVVAGMFASTMSTVFFNSFQNSFSKFTKISNVFL